MNDQPAPRRAGPPMEPMTGRSAGHVSATTRTINDKRAVSADPVASRRRICDVFSWNFRMLLENLFARFNRPVLVRRSQGAPRLPSFGTSTTWALRIANRTPA